MRNTRSFRFSGHARERMCRRRISEPEIEAVLRHGKMIRERGARHFVVLRTRASRGSPRDPSLEAVKGIHVIVAPDGDAVLTVYKNRGGFKLRRGSWKQRRASRRRL